MMMVNVVEIMMIVIVTEIMMTVNVVEIMMIVIVVEIVGDFVGVFQAHGDHAPPANTSLIRGKDLSCTRVFHTRSKSWS